MGAWDTVECKKMRGFLDFSRILKRGFHDDAKTTWNGGASMLSSISIFEHIFGRSCCCFFAVTEIPENGETKSYHHDRLCGGLRKNKKELKVWNF